MVYADVIGFLGTKLRAKKMSPLLLFLGWGVYICLAVNEKSRYNDFFFSLDSFCV